MRTLAAGLAGLVFGAGLLVSGMTNPAKVLGFLDLAGAWDPTLAFVMGGALGVNALGWAWTRRRARPLLAAEFALPSANAVDGRLLVGGALFGLGWGLVGLCPGPALAGLLRGEPALYVFVAALLVGTWVAGRTEQRYRLRVAPSLPRSLAIVAALALAARAIAGDANPFGAAPGNPIGSSAATPRPVGPGAPISDVAPWLSSHPSSPDQVFLSGPQTNEDYRFLRNQPTTLEFALHPMVVRDVAPAGPGGCSGAWFAANSCDLVLGPGLLPGPPAGLPPERQPILP